MQIKYTHQFQRKLEDLLVETEYHLRYEKGNFQSGYCILKDTRIIIINKFFSLEGKINCLVDIIRSLDVNPENLTAKNRSFLLSLYQLDYQS